MKKDKEHIHYSIDYLRKYLNGELTGKEMQALEKDSLEDPFLSDTIDGLRESNNHPSSFESGMENLRTRLAERTGQKKKRGLAWILPRWQIAASALLLAALTTLTVNMLIRSNREKSISLVKKSDTAQATAPPASREGQSKSDTPEKAASAPVPEPNTFARRHVQGKRKLANKIPASASVERSEDDQQQNLHNYVQGRVLDVSGKAIASATVRLKNEDRATTTDSTGYFKLSLEKEKKNQEIAINSVGFGSVHKSVSPDTTLLQIQMQPESTSLNEVVVTGYSSQKKKDVSASVPVSNNHPTGWQELNTYIDKNKRISNADSVLTGEEVISFDVDDEGRLSSIKVIKSISPTHDDEVIRLLKSGPRLQTKEIKKTKYQISVFFK